MRLIYWILFLVLLFCLGAFVIGFPGQYNLFKISFLGFLVFYFALLFYFTFKVKNISKSFKLFLSESINISLVISIIAMVFYTTNQYPMFFDLTSQNINGLTSWGKKVLSKVKSPLEVDIIAEKKDWKYGIEIFQLLKSQQSNLSYRFKTPEASAIETSQLGINKLPALIYKFQDKKTFNHDLSVDGILKKTLSLVDSKEYKVCWYSDSKLDAFEGLYPRYKYLKSLINLEGYQFINATKDEVLNCQVVFFFERSYYDKEYFKTLEVLNNNENIGTLLFLSPDLSNKRESFYWEKLKSLNINAVNGLALDNKATKKTGQPFNLLIDTKDFQSEVGSALKGELIYPMSLGFVINSSYQSLFKTSSYPNSWLETDTANLEKNATVRFDNNSDLKGPINLALLNSEKKSVVFGSSLFISDEMKQYTLNFELVLNVLSSFLERDLNVEKRPELQKEYLHFSQVQINLIIYLSLILLPLSFLLIAFYQYRKK